ncbi:MAG: hypothetical protein ACAH83_19510 [Alphaproteobacteria bacterium]
MSIVPPEFRLKKIVWPVLMAVIVAGLWMTSRNAVADTHGSKVWRYRMTVTVETPEGLKTGSAVREVSYQKGIALTPEMLPNIGLKGEAIVVDLGKYGVLFALLTGAVHGPDYGSDIIFNVLPAKGVKSGRDRIPPKGEIVRLTPAQYPLFVRFGDLNDPKSLEGVTRAEMSGINTVSYFLKGEMFGDGVQLKEVTIELTDDDVTWTIEKWLKWLPERKGKRYFATIMVGPSDNPDRIRFIGREFSNGRYW